MPDQPIIHRAAPGSAAADRAVRRDAPRRGLLRPDPAAAAALVAQRRADMPRCRGLALEQGLLLPTTAGARKTHR